jgi:hypothetical protein
MSLVCIPADNLPGFELADDTMIVCELHPNGKQIRPLFNLTRAIHLVRWAGTDTPAPANDT